jgi:hypothetical protein
MTLPAFSEVKDRRCDECKWWWKIPLQDDEGYCTNKGVDFTTEFYPCTLWQPKED